MTLNDIQTAVGGGTTYRAYGHAMAARDGLLITLPLTLVDGRLTALVDACQRIARCADELKRAMARGRGGAAHARGP